MESPAARDVVQLLKERDALRAENAALRAANARLEQTMEVMEELYREKLADLRRRLYGPSSEEVDPKQLELAYESARDDEILAETAPQNLPVERIVLDVPEAERVGLVRIREEVTEEIDYVPSRFIRRHYVRPVYAHPKKLTAPIVAPLPARVIPQSGVGSGLLAQVVVSRFTDHVPYYRQEQIYARAGVQLPRQKLGRWVEQVALLLQGIHGQLRERVLASGYCQADETPVDVLGEERPGAAQAAWLWTYHSPPAHAVVFDFHLSRGRDGPWEFIPPDWRGVLQTDGYELYRALCAERPGIVHAGCLADARRKWIEAVDGGGELVAKVLADFATLYRVEAEARERRLSAVDRAQLRQHRSELVLARLRQKLEVAKAAALPQSRVGLAAAYAVTRWESLCRFAQPDYGHVEIDNNAVENSIRPSALGKRSWLFIGHPEAGWKSAVLYSVLGTCKLLKVDPDRYLNWVLPQLAAATNITASSGLLPHDYAAAVKERDA